MLIEGLEGACLLRAWFRVDEIVKLSRKIFSNDCRLNLVIPVTGAIREVI